MISSKKQSCYSQEVFLPSSVFVADFAQAFAIFLHEHTHILGHDGSRVSDVLTKLIESVLRNRKKLNASEEAWDKLERGSGTNAN